MPRLDKKQLQQHRLALEAWQRPDELLARAVSIREDMGDEFFIQPGLTFAREAWGAAKFGIARGAQAARLAPGEFPDFELRLGAVVEQWEFTEADDEQRRRSDDYREGRPRSGDYLALIEQGPGEIRRVCTDKASQHYSQKVGLLVLLNIAGFGARQEETLASLPDATAPAKDAFSEVWVLWDDRAFPVWRDGRRVSG